MGASQGKILIIDDVEMNRAILREAFIEHYDILEAENGYIGLEQIEESMASSYCYGLFPAMVKAPEN